MPNSEPIPTTEAPPPARFAVRGQPFQLDALDWIYRLEDLAEEVKKAGGTHRQYLAQLTDLLETETGVRLTAGEADWLNDHLAVQHAEAKKKRRDAFAAALASPSSTASTPAD